MPDLSEKAGGLSDVLKKWESIQFGWILVIIAVATLLILAIRKLTPWVAGKLPDRLRFYVLPWVPILRLIIVVTAIVQVVPLVIRPTPENLFALLGATAIAIGFAFKELASSVIAGIVVLFEQPYRAGDWVTVDGAYGEVVSIGFRSFSMVTPDDTVVTVPHAKTWDTVVYNENSGRRELQCVTNFYLHPAHDAEAVRQALWDVGVTSPYLRLERPVVVVVAETPWATHYRLKAYPIDGRDQFQFISDLTIRGKAALAELDVEFASAPLAGVT